MENDPREIELNFNDRTESAGWENAGEQVFGAADRVNPESESVFCAGNENGVEETSAGNDMLFQDAALEEVQESSDIAEIPVPEAGADVLRSRQPMNRPAGTPPLENVSGCEKISAMELAIIGKSYGTALRMLREHYQVTYQELEQATLIQPHYLEALENENLAALPPLAYVIAFVRSLCRFYKLSGETGDQMVAKLKPQLEYTCNDELMNSLDVDATGLEVNERRIKRIVWGTAGVLLAAVALTVLIIMLVNNSGTPRVTVVDVPESKQRHFDPNSVYPLLEPPTLDLPKLPVAE